MWTKGTAIGIIVILSIMPILPSGKDINEASIGRQNNDMYYSYEDLTTLLQVLHVTYPAIFSYSSLGKTHEGRDIWLAKISDNVESNESEEPDVLYSGGMHGNEKPGYQNIIETMISLLENYTLPYVNASFSIRIRTIVNQSELFFIPMINPDGCEASTRKNRRENNGCFGSTILRGVDIGKNFDIQWDDADEHPFRYIFIPKTAEDWKFLRTHDNFYLFERSVVRLPSLDFGSLIKCGVYRGPSPFSEPESRAIKQVVEDHHILIWLDYHIFGEEIRLPEVPQYNNEDDKGTFYSIAENISQVNGYTIFEPPQCLNQSGRGLEWTYTKYTIFSFIIELCPSMDKDVLYDKEFIEEVFEDHLYVNIYTAERAIEMSSMV